MRKIDMYLLDAIDMCKYVEQKCMEKDLQSRLYTDMLLYSFYVCGQKFNKKQEKYINALLAIDACELTENLKGVDEKQVVKKVDVLKVFVVADNCFGTSDVKYKGKKALTLIELFRELGNDLCDMEDKEADKKKSLRRSQTYLEAMLSFAIAGKGIVATNAGAGNDMNTNADIKEPEDEGKTLDELVEEFNKLTGLQSVKDEINGLINLVKVSKMRQERGFKESSISKHMVFTGNPGTGKTTVARLLANIYHKLGVLSKGQLVEVDRSGLVAGYVGQTAIKTDEVLQKAKGGILFIDEAYMLTENKGEGDFGQEAVDTILKAMEDNRDDLVVIVAGYPEPMDGFLNSNPGLKSRFNKFILFEDYSKEELLNIFKSMCSSMDYKISEEDEEQVIQKIADILEENNKSFANARTMRNMLEFAVMQQASRIVNEESLSDEELLTIKYVDLADYELQ